METTPVFLPGQSHRQRNLAGYSPLGSKELDTTEMTQHAANSQLALRPTFLLWLSQRFSVFCHSVFIGYRIYLFIVYLKSVFHIRLYTTWGYFAYHSAPTQCLKHKCLLYNVILFFLFVNFIFLCLFTWLHWVLVVAPGLSVASCGIQFPNQGLNPGPLHWECRDTTTGLPGMSQVSTF